METFALYLLKSALWLPGFALVYIVFLQNERYFLLNRIFLVGGILAAVFLPFYTWHYTVEFNTESVGQFAGNQQQVMNDTTLVVDSFSVQKGLLFLYLVGVLFVIIRILKSTIPVLRVIFKVKTYRYEKTKLIRNAEFLASFSLISYVFVHPSIDEPELREIVKHEQEHIRQKHWVDLLLFEILRTIQWFNPVVWFYGRLIRQNHEYLADKHALQSSSNPGIYRAALLNQTFGGSIIPLTSSFNYSFNSFNKKRFKMMNHTIQSPFRKLKLLLILPVFAGILYAFARPEYQSETTTKTQEETILEEKIKLGNIIWKGNSVYTSSELSQALGLKKGDVISSEQQFEEQIIFGLVRRLYNEKGYLLCNVECLPTKKADGSTDFNINISEGKQFKIGAIEVVGNNENLRDDILKAISIKCGELFSNSKLKESIDDLSETGRFGYMEVFPDIKAGTVGIVDVVFIFREK